MKIKDILYKNATYTSIADTMLSYQVAYLGGTQFKRLTRKKRPSEDEKLHIDLINHTVAQPICRYIVDTINDIVFEPGIKRDLCFATPEGRKIESDLTDWAELITLDATLDNRSMDAFMESVGDLTSIFGHCWIFVDMPTEEQGNLGRPYATTVSPLNVWDWDFECVRGVHIPEMIKVLEYEEEDSWYFKIYHLGTTDNPSWWEAYEVPKETPAETDIEPYAQGQFPAGMSIPGFIAFGRRDPRRIDIGISDIDAATDAMKEHYKLECEAYQSIQFAKTLIRADAGIKIPAHAGAIVRATQGQVETISVDTQDVDMIIRKQEAILQQLESLTGMGGLRQNRGQAQSGISQIQERKGLHRVAGAKARLMEVAEEMIWTYMARFMGVRWAGEVTYNTDYEAHDTQYRLALLQQAKSLVPDNQLINGLIAKELIAMIAPPNEVYEYEQALMATQDPNLQMLEREEESEVYTRDIGDQVPTPEAADEQMSETESESETDTYGGLGENIIYTGQSSYNPVADQLVGQASGR